MATYNKKFASISPLSLGQQSLTQIFLGIYMSWVFLQCLFKVFYCSVVTLIVSITEMLQF